MSSLALNSACSAEKKHFTISTTDVLAPFTSLFLSKKIRKMKITENLAIQLASLLVRITRSAFESFQAQQFDHFDALVGETSCQLRAAKLRLLFKAGFSEKLSASHQMAVLIDKSLPAIKTGSKELLVAEDQLKKFGKETKLHEQIIINKLAKQFFISNDEQFIILTHLLTRTRDRKDRMTTNADNLCDFLSEKEDEALQFFKKEGLLETITFSAKELLAKLSIEFLKTQVQALKIPKKEEDLLKALSKATLATSGNLLCSPFFFNIRILFENIRNTHGLIVLKIQRKITEEDSPFSHFALAFSSNGHFFELLQAEQAAKCAEEPAIVITGCSVSSETDTDILFKERLLGDTDQMDSFPGSRLLQIIFANAAAHSQYAGKSARQPITLFDRHGKGVDLEEDVLKMIDDQISKDASLTIEQIIADKKNQFPMEVAKQLCGPLDLVGVAKAYLQLNQMKRFALAEGLCQENKSLLCIQHITFNTMGNELLQNKKGIVS